MTTQTLSTAWQNLGSGPFAVSVLTGVLALKASESRPLSSDITGTIIAAVVGAQPTHLAEDHSFDWWGKALVGNTVISIAIEAVGQDLPSSNPQIAAGADRDAASGDRRAARRDVSQNALTIHLTMR